MLFCQNGVRLELNLAWRSVRWVVVVLIHFAVIPPLAAQDSIQTPERQQLSLNQATNLAISNSPEIRQISWLIDQKIANGFQQSRLVNPQIGTIINEAGNEGQAGQYGFFIQRNIVRNNRAQQIQNAAQWQARSLELLHQVRQRKLARNIANLFVQIEFQKKQQKLVAQKKDELIRIRKIVQMLVSGGELSRLELNRIDIEIETTSQKSDMAKTAINSSIKLLKTFIGNELEFELDFDFDEEVKLVLGSSFRRDIPIDQHPSVKEIDNKIEAQQWQVQLAQSRQKPDWVVQTSVNYDFSSDDFFGGMQLNVPWQVNDRKQGLIASESAEMQILRETRSQVLKRLERRLIELGRDREKLVSQIRSIDDKVIPQVDEIARLTSELFHNGEADVTSVKTAIMDSFAWREKSLNLSQQLLKVEAETETLILD